MKVFYHDDLDGRCAGFWVKRYAEKTNKIIECIPVNYNIPFPLNTIKVDEEVWIVDFSISIELMLDLLAQTEKVIWIDHHKTSIEKYKDFKYKIPGLRKDGTSACELTWAYAEELLVLPNCELHWTASEVNLEKCPYFTKLIGDRDIWKFEHGRDTELFFLGMCALDTNPESKVWVDLENQILYNKNTTYLRHIINSGETIENYKKQWTKEYRDTWGFEIEFEGYKCYAMNLGKCGSESFGEKVNKYDVVIPFVMDKFGKWNISFYSAKVDVSEIAKKYGGGGHKGASGTVLAELPFKILK